VRASCGAVELRPWPTRARRRKRKEEKEAKVCGSGWEMEQRSSSGFPIYRRRVRATRAWMAILGVRAEEGNVARISRWKVDMGHVSAEPASGRGSVPGSRRSLGFPTQGAALSQLSRRARAAC
jgi:hypothetical protein